ncbi:MAG TPA: tetratricopeptide repeat protein, partial [Anaerolineales bacterium]
MSKNEVNGISFGEWLRQRRHILDLTQQELADQVGCARITLRRIEAGALRPSRELSIILLQKLGVPQAELETWVRFARGLEGFPAILSDSGPGKRITNLPTLLTSFIGREKEQQEILDLIRKYHLVTLVGLAGVGKTRLSLQATRDVLKMFPDGVWFVDLAPMLDPLLVSRTTALTIGLHEEPQRPVIDVLCDFLSEKNMLLILDGCEHLVDACAHMAEKILQQAPNVRIVATSREALGITGELTYRVHALELPDLKHLPPLGLLSKYEAIALFIDRATAVAPTFQIMDSTAPILAQICSRLDGIPLAIELAAAKLGVLSLSQISERLDDRFRLLTGGSRTAAPQHQTLQAAIDWSYDLLSPSEQTLFRRLAVFVNGWTLEAAEFICSGVGIQSEEVLELLTQLISKSLVNREETINKPRYRMLETIRAYALKKLEASGEIKDTCLRHLIFFGQMVDEAERNFKGPHQAIWYSRLDRELDNLRMAMTWFGGVEHGEIRLQFIAGLWRYWKNRGHTSEGRQHLKDILEDLPPGPDRQTFAYARALNAAGSLAYYEGDLVYSERSRRQALAIFQNLNDKAGIANCLNGLGNTAISQGNHDSALQAYQESLAIRRELGDKWGIARLLGNLGLLAYFEMDYPRAR